MTTKLIRLGTIGLDAILTGGIAALSNQFSGAGYLPGYKRTVTQFRNDDPDVLDVFAEVERVPLRVLPGGRDRKGDTTELAVRQDDGH